MGTTKTALQAGSTQYAWVVAIEGYQYLLTNGTEDGATDSWAATNYTSVLQGLYVDLENEQSISPWEPFTSGGNLTLRVSPDASDQLGIDFFKKIYTGETALASSVDSDDTTITVRDTTTFAASGTAYIGTEIFTYSSKAATTFTVSSRGTLCPFANGNTGTVFGRPHRVSTDPNGVNLQPAVTSSPRVWKGRWVGLWAHRDVGGTLDLRSEAQLVFPGRIAEYHDDPSAKGATVIDCEHLLDYVKDATLGRDMWSAKIVDGVYLRSGFAVAQIGDGPTLASTLSTGNAFMVVSGAPANADEIQAGFYTYDQLLSALNSYFKYELDNGRITGTYTLYFGYGFENEGSPPRTFLEWTIPGGGHAYVKLGLSTTLAQMLGVMLDTELVSSSNTGNRFRVLSLDDDAGAISTFESSESPLRSLFTSDNTADGGSRFGVTDERGTFEDQLATMPHTCPISDDQGLEWGLFLVDNKVVVYGARDTSGGSTVLTSIRLPRFLYTGDVQYDSFKQFYDKLKRGHDDPPVEIRQIFIIDDSFANIINWIFWSTGTAGYNHATYDILPHTLSLSIPGELLGSEFTASVTGLPCANAREVLVLDKPKKLSEILRGSLVARWAFLRWKDQHLQFATWKTPTTALSVATLDDTNKAAGASVSDEHRTSTLHTDKWQYPIVRWEYDRDISKNDPGGGFRSDITFEDATAVDDAGGVAPTLTIQLPNVYEKATVEELASQSKPLMTMFTRGNEIINRSLDARYWEGYAVGDVVLVSDGSARDPDTGQRGVTTRPGLVTRHRWAPGGWTSPSSTQSSEMDGEVEIMLLPVNRTAAYVPCADFDGTNYNAGTKVITADAHAYSESSESADASNFPATSKVRVVQRDPANAASPLQWDDTVASQSGNTITLTTGLTPGFDAAKKYRVIFDDYGDCTATQQVKCFQADDADYLVANARQPYHYAYGQIDSGTVTANSASDAAELIPNSASGDGVGRDVGHDLAQARTIRSLIDYGTAHSGCHLSNDVMSGTGATGTYKLVDVSPLYIHQPLLIAGNYRNLSVAPWFRSSDGTAATVRVSVVRYFPNEDSVNDIDLGMAFASATFTTSSTTWQTPTAVDITIDAALVDELGYAYLLIECTTKAESRGLAACQVSERKVR